MVPNDPAILLSFLNTRLRDDGCTLEELCALIGQARQSEAELIMTGTVYPQELDEYADEITKVQTRYEHCEG